MGAKIGLDIHSPLIILCGKRGAINAAIAYAKQQKSGTKEGGGRILPLKFLPILIVWFYFFDLDVTGWKNGKYNVFVKAV